MKGFARRLYHPENMLLYVLGNVDPEKIVRMAEKTCHTIIGNRPQQCCQQATALLPTSHTIISDKPREVSCITRKKDTHQAHVII
jgi:predicted Zn-dependent peptidase